jgi:hypothetical protein
MKSGMKKVLMKMTVTKIIIMIMIKIMNEMGTLLLIQNHEDSGDDVYDDGDSADKGDVYDYATH